MLIEFDEHIPGATTQMDRYIMSLNVVIMYVYTIMSCARITKCNI